VAWCSSDFFPIDTTFYVSPKLPDTSMRYLYHALIAQGLPALGADSAVPGLNRNIAYMNLLLVPPSLVQAAFDKLMMPLVRRCDLNDQECRTLAAIRDALLPKLMSGEVRVKETARVIGTQDG
jgi:type I restriction enzyme S subunit